MTTCQMTDVQKVLLGIVDGPAYADACDHPPHEYQFTVECLGRKVDVYLYDYRDGRHGVCLRKSGECSDYESGQIEWFIRSLASQDGPERSAIVALLATHYVRLTPRDKANN